MIIQPKSQGCKYHVVQDGFDERRVPVEGGLTERCEIIDGLVHAFEQPLDAVAHPAFDGLDNGCLSQCGDRPDDPDAPPYHSCGHEHRGQYADADIGG